MQKSYLQAAVAIIIALILAFGVKTAYISALGRDPETELLEEIGDLMIEAQDVFGNNVERFLEISGSVEGHDGLVLIRGGDGGVYSLQEDGVFLPAQEDAFVSSLLWLFEGVEAENSDTGVTTFMRLYSVTVTEERIYLYTGLSESGAAGLVYDRTGKGVQGLDSIALYDNWHQFSIIDDGGERLWGI